MKQAILRRNLNAKKSCKQVLQDQIEKVVPCVGLIEVVAQIYPEDKSERPPFSKQTMLRVHFMQQ